MRRDAIELNDITVTLEVIPEHMGKLLQMRYIEEKEWFKITMEIGYVDTYVRKQLRNKSLQVVAEQRR